MIIAVIVCTSALLLYPRLAHANLWRATITPLASIIGSGYLVIGPILHGSFGLMAPMVMALLCGGAYLFGAAIRHNIATIEAAAPRPRAEMRLETLSSWALAFAYAISVAYYLNLFGEFGLSLTRLDDPFHARILASGVFLVILAVGLTHGFRALERVEQITVGINLSIIAGMLFGMGWYFVGKVGGGDGLVIEAPHLSGWAAATLVFGLVVTVQGFEISRYLGGQYDAATRIRSMKLAQWVSSAIYLVYITLLTFSFQQGEIPLSETAIIELMGIVAPILAVLLVAAARAG